MPSPGRVSQKEKMELDRDYYGHPSVMVEMTMQIIVTSAFLNVRTYSLPGKYYLGLLIFIKPKKVRRSS